MQPRAERITFIGSQGDKLAARLDLPGGPVNAYALFAHCFSCSKDVLTAARLSTALNARGIAVLRFDFTGLGNSQGDFANTNFSSNVDDLLLAAQFMREQYQAPQLLIGHSLGGAAALAVAGELAELKAVATLNAPSDPSHVSHLFRASVPEIEARGEAEVQLAGRKFRIRKQFLDDIAEQKLLDKVSRLRKPLMIFHSPVDKIVNIDHAAHIYLAAKHPKSFVSLDDADHMVSRPADADFVASVLSAWAGRYMDVAENETETTPQAGAVAVRESSGSLFAQDIRIGQHRLKADEPVSYGGRDLGPSPYDLLLAGLGACTTMTLRMYANRKQLPLEHVAVTLNHDKIHAQDCERCETENGKIDRIQRSIQLHGELNAQQRATLLEIADKCPVHRTLHSEVLIETELAK